MSKRKERCRKRRRRKRSYRKELFASTVFGWLWGGIYSIPTYAQISQAQIPQAQISQAQTLNVYADGSTDTVITGSHDCSTDCIITGTSRSGDSLFHSFDKFSLAEGATATFKDNGATNIFARVLNEVSMINGTLAVTGSGRANFFLLNRHGIIFGPNAALSTAGSFVASTAENMIFSNGSQFGATNTGYSSSDSLLTVSTPVGAPVGLQFGAHPGDITNYSQASSLVASNPFPLPVGLQVRADQTLALLGSGINLAGGNLTARSGQIEIGSVTANSLVSVSPSLHMGYETVPEFSDVRITQAAQIDVGGDRGFVSIYGRSLFLEDDSSIYNQITASESPGSIELFADETIELDSSAIYFSRTFGNLGEGVALDISTNRLVLKNGSLLLGATLSGMGDGGNITINALESVALIGASRRTTNYITASSNSDGAGGDVAINTRRLFVSDGSQIESIAGSAGEGGDIAINATDLVEVSGEAPPWTASAANRLLTVVGLDLESTATEPSVSRISATSGLAEINSAQSTAPGGSLTINTEKLSIRDKAQITVGSFGSGDSGNLEINARSVRLDNGAQLSAAANLADGGNLRLVGLDTLILRRGSSISTSAGMGDGGNLWIDADFVVAQAFEDSDIVAKATGGQSGNITIDTSGVYGIVPRKAIANNGTSDIDASSEFGVSGITAITQVTSTAAINSPILTARPLDISATVIYQCGASGNSFVVSARGGVPLTPAGAVAMTAPIVDLGGDLEDGYSMDSDRIAEDSASALSATLAADNPSWVEAQSWYTDERGQIVLSTQPQQNNDVSFSTVGHCSG